jgi:hemerythrin-like domain-containing protein
MAKPTTTPWADTPFPLIPTPGRSQSLSSLPPATFMAREMACAHNGMLRGLNSIYHQCTHIRNPQDINDFLLYTKFWCGWIHEHHDVEEQFLFPDVERITGVKGLMERNVLQHQAFMPGLEEFQRYAEETTSDLYNGEELQKIIDKFGSKLTQHLTEEIETLLGLEIYNGPVLKDAYVKFDLEFRKGNKVSFFYSVCSFLLRNV